MKLAQTIALAGTLTFASAASAQTVSLIVVVKIMVNRQTSAVDVNLFAQNNRPFGFDVQVEGDDIDKIVAPVVSGPILNPEPGHNGGTLGLNKDGDVWRYGFPDFRGWGEQSLADLNNTFSDGTYTVSVSGVDVVLGLSGQAFPTSPPLLTLTGGAWANSEYVIDPDQQLTITTSPYAGYGSHTEDAIFIEIGGPNYFQVLDQLASDEPSNTATLIVPANSLTPGGTYRVECGHIAVVDLKDDIAALPDALAVAAYEQLTSLTVRVTGCPADWNQDAVFNTADFVAYLNDFNAVMNGGSPTFADPDIAPPSGVLNTADFVAYLNLFAAGCA